MVKCPFCQFDNEDGALFCEQCKSDLGVAEPVPMAHPVVAMAEAAPAEPFPMAAPVSETEPMAATPEEMAELASALPATSPGAVEPTIPMAAPIEEFAETPSATPVAEAVEATPFAPPASEPVPLPPGTAPEAMAPSTAVEGEQLPAGTQPKLTVLRGLKIGVDYPIYEGHNFVGRADEKPVDIDLDDQEPPDRVWSSRQHALITFEEGRLLIEDLNSANGTFVNRTRVYPGQKRGLQLNDVIQIGTVQMKVKG